MEKIDLHIHTNLSDGNHDINSIINFSKKNQCNKIAITDHEIINDYSIVAKENNIEIINGVEFNTSEKGLHILGYGIKNIQMIQEKMDFLHRENEHISFELVEALRKLNYDISIEQIEEYLYIKEIKYKYLDKRHIAKYLIDKGFTKDIPDTYNNLIGKGTSLYIPLKKINPSEIINLITNSGGVSVIAHPITLGLSEKEFLFKIKELIFLGINGVEIINGKKNINISDFYNRVGDDFNLIKTVGSDFHSVQNDEIGIECEKDIFENLKSKIKSKQL